MRAYGLRALASKSNSILIIVESRKLEHHYPHAPKVKYRES